MKRNEPLVQAMQAAEEAVLRNLETDHIYGVRGGDPPIAPWPTHPCRIIFLDIDGVLNCDRSIEALGTRYRFHKGSVAALNEVLIRSGGLIVITSTWREHWTLREVAEFLERDGVVANRVVGKTPASGPERGNDIDAWLGSAPYPVRSFVILDDRSDMAMHRERLVQVDAAAGLCREHMERAVSLLEAP